jgi:hypothetical protein
MKEKLEKVIQDSVSEMVRAQGMAVPDSWNDVVLFGAGGLFDSMALVSLVILVEERVQEVCGQEILLVNEKAMSQRNSPFRTVDSLVEYVESLLEPVCIGEK